MKFNTKAFFENEDKVNEKLKKYSDYNKSVESESKFLVDMMKEDFCTIDESDLVKETNKALMMYNKYSLLYAEKKPFLTKLNQTRDELRGFLFDYYLFEYDKSTKITKSLADEFIATNSLYKEICKCCENFQVLLELIQRGLDYCKNRSYAIKNIIEIQKIKFGLI